LKERLVENPRAYRHAVKELTDYFGGRQVNFTFPFNLIVSGFDRRALLALSRVKYGSTLSYQELANRAGSARAARAAGGACARNPLPLRIPCHRVLKADGTIGGWSGLPGLKEKLLKLEKVIFKSKGSR
ncbi:MAG: methylated-DNA--[protein]-cysteine S-methyltransferase, partial [candidate division Zixibacteria bacterium]|nr:methylated-DNA--[protein]-cysteine S-methyltransferase [candidate division Zixibacteria bacterium]